MGEAIDLPENSCDFVVSTLVLCTVNDPLRCIKQIKRVLRPSGVFVFIEHVRAKQGSLLALVQRSTHEPWHWFFEGCHTNRDTKSLLVSAVEDLGFEPDEVKKAIEVIKSGMLYAKTLDNWERHQKVLDKYQGKEWLNVASGPPTPDHWLWNWVNPVLDFDAVPLVSETKASILVILGEKDRVVPAQISER